MVYCFSFVFVPGGGGKVTHTQTNTHTYILTHPNTYKFIHNLTYKHAHTHIHGLQLFTLDEKIPSGLWIKRLNKHNQVFPWKLIWKSILKEILREKKYFLAFNNILWRLYFLDWSFSSLRVGRSVTDSPNRLI